MAALLPPGVSLCEIPALQPPDGMISNFVDPPSLALTTWIICITLTTVSVSLVVVRLYTNRQNLDVADYFMAVAAVLTITYTGLIVSLHRYDRHQWNVPVCWLDEHYLRVIFAHITIVGSVIFFPKCAIFLMYLRTFPQKSMKIGVWIGLTFTFCTYFPTIPLSAIYGAPAPGHTWEELLEHLMTSTDHSMIYWGIANGSCSVALDLYIFTLPLPTLFRLKTSLGQRLQLVALFATALFGVLASVIALIFRADLLHNKDNTWGQARLSLCIVTENNVAIAVGCMPAFIKFIRHHVTPSAIFRSLKLKLLGHAGRGESDPTCTRAPEPAIPKGTFGSPPWKKRLPNHYYELTDSATMQTHTTVVDAESPPPNYAHGP